MRVTGTRRTLLAVSAGGALLVAGTGLIAVLEGVVGVDDASASYLLPVLAMAALFGFAAAIATSFGAFLLYDFFFVEPRFTLTISDAGEFLNLVLLVVVGAIVGLLASALRSRAEVAQAREREARSLFRVSRALATRHETKEVLQRDVRENLDYATDLGAEVIWVEAADVPTGLAELVGRRDATHLFVPHKASSGFAGFRRRPLADELMERLGDAELHVVGPASPPNR